MQAEPPAGQHGQLLALSADVQMRSFVLREAVCLLGRAAECHLIVARATVSRVHARIERVGSRYYLHDEASANGTFINTRQIREPYKLGDNDVIGLGGPAATLRFVDADPTVIHMARLRYDERARVFMLDQAPLALTPLQFRLMEHLYRHAGELCEREGCAAAVWGGDYDPGLDAGNLDRLVNSLRARLVVASGDPDIGTALIQTRRAQGYLLVLSSM
jgi:DNA-binding response OmpR family regulator